MTYYQPTEMFISAQRDEIIGSPDIVVIPWRGATPLFYKGIVLR